MSRCIHFSFEQLNFNPVIVFFCTTPLYILSFSSFFFCSLNLVCQIYHHMRVQLLQDHFDQGSTQRQSLPLFGFYRRRVNDDFLKLVFIYGWVFCSGSMMCSQLTSQISVRMLFICCLVHMDAKLVPSPTYITVIDHPLRVL